jgi:hypothetical protein
MCFVAVGIQVMRNIDRSLAYSPEHGQPTMVVTRNTFFSRANWRLTV